MFVNPHFRLGACCRFMRSLLRITDVREVMCQVTSFNSISSSIREKTCCMVLRYVGIRENDLVLQKGRLLIQRSGSSSDHPYLGKSENVIINTEDALAREYCSRGQKTQDQRLHALF